MGGETTDTKGNIPEAPPGFFRQFQDDLLALTKARLSVLVVITAIFGYFIAVKGNGTFSAAILLHTFIGTVLAAFGAAVFNQLMEVESDARMTRTSDRPLPANRLPKAAAFILGWLLSAFGIIHLGAKVDFWASAMAAATLLTYLFIYTPMKRVSSVNTVFGAISGALPPLIGWAAGGRELLEWGALFLFLLLFFWQMPHFAAINWMYRQEYSDGGFKMWSNNDETGKKTAKIALFFSLCIVAMAIVLPLVMDEFAVWGIIPGALLGAIMAWLSLRFLKSGTRKDARTLFFYTLLYLPLMMIAAYFSWV